MRRSARPRSSSCCRPATPSAGSGRRTARGDAGTDQRLSRSQEAARAFRGVDQAHRRCDQDFLPLAATRGIASRKTSRKSIPLPRTERYLPETMNELQVERLLDGIDVNAPRGLRDRAILELLYASGLRVSELVNARLENPRPRQPTSFASPARGTRRASCPVGTKACDAIRASISTASVRDSCSKRRGSEIFLSSRGGRKLTTVRIWQIVKECAKTRRPRSQRLSAPAAALASPRIC